MNTSFIRAHGEEQKAIRIEQIISRTRELYEQFGYDKITFSLIAETQNFTRVNIYNYFHSKEDLFLEIIRRDTDSLCAAVTRSFQNMAFSTKSFVKRWTWLMIQHHQLLDLYVLMNTRILPYLPEEEHRAFQAYLDDSFMKMANSLQTMFPTLSHQALISFIDFEIIYAMGLYPPFKRTSSAHIDSPFVTRHFADNYSHFLTIVLNGLMADTECPTHF